MSLSSTNTHYLLHLLIAASGTTRPIGTFTQTSASMATADKMSVRLFGRLAVHVRFRINFAGE
jgi:hypothetical protein